MVNVHFSLYKIFFVFASVYGHVCYYKNDFIIESLTVYKRICIFSIDAILNSKQRHAGILFTILSRLLVHVFHFRCFIVSSKLSC